MVFHPSEMGTSPHTLNLAPVIDGVKRKLRFCCKRADQLCCADGGMPKNRSTLFRSSAQHLGSGPARKGSLHPTPGRFDYPLTQTRSGIPLQASYALPPDRNQFQRGKARRPVDRTSVSAKEFPGRS